MKTIKTSAVKAAIIGAASVMMPVMAFAEQTSADECASELSDTAKEIYDAVAPTIEAGDNVQKKIKAQVRPMVDAGEISKGEARSAAKEAKKCLDLIQS